MNSSVKIPVLLTVAGLDPSGGAGVIADVKTFTRLNCFAAAAVTSITFQNTTGVFGAEHQSATCVRRQLDAIASDYTIAAIKTGMLPSAEVIAEVATFVRALKRTPLVVDPVVRSTSGYDLISHEALGVLTRELFPLASLVTPNIAEAERITGLQVRNVDEMCEAARVMRRTGARCVLVKGGHLTSDPIDVLCCGRSCLLITGHRVESNSTHGTGCVLSSAIAANLAQGLSLEGAVHCAKSLVESAIRTAPGLGSGHGPVNPNIP